MSGGGFSLLLRISGYDYTKPEEFRSAHATYTFTSTNFHEYFVICTHYLLPVPTTSFGQDAATMLWILHLMEGSKHHFVSPQD